MFLGAVTKAPARASANDGDKSDEDLAHCSLLCSQRHDGRRGLYPPDVAGSATWYRLYRMTSLDTDDDLPLGITGVTGTIVTRTIAPARQDVGCGSFSTERSRQRVPSMSDMPLKTESGVLASANGPSWVCNRLFNVLVANGDAVVPFGSHQAFRSLRHSPRTGDVAPVRQLLRRHPTRSNAARHAALTLAHFANRG